MQILTSEEASLLKKIYIIILSVYNEPLSLESLKRVLGILKLIHIRHHLSQFNSSDVERDRIRALKLCWRGMLFANNIKKYSRSSNATLNGVVERVEQRHEQSSILGSIFVQFFLAFKQIRRQELKERVHEACQRVRGDTLTFPSVDLMSAKESSLILSFACEKGRVDVLNGVFRFTCLTVNSMNENYETPLGIAVSTPNNSVLIRELLRWDGIDVNYPSMYNGKLLCPLVIACMMEHESNVEELLKHPDIYVNSLSSSYTVCALHALATNGNLSITRCLLAHPHIQPSMPSSVVFTPLHLACMYGHVEIVRVLLTHPRIDVNAATRHNETPLMLACKKKHEDIVDVLLSDPRVEVDIPDSNHNMTPLLLASTLQCATIVKKLIHCKANPNIQSKSGVTPALASVQFNNMHILKLLAAHPSMDIFLCDHRGQTPMSIARRGTPSMSTYVCNLVQRQLSAEKGASIH